MLIKQLKKEIHVWKFFINYTQTIYITIVNLVLLLKLAYTLRHYFAEMTERLGAWLQTTILGFNSQSRPTFFNYIIIYGSKLNIFMI
jgi:hypothetical protein